MSSADGPVLVVGCGSIGRRHARNLLALGRRVLAFDPEADRRRWFERELRVPTVALLRRAWEAGPSAVWVCTPPSAHRAVALEAIRRGLPAFIEKPLAHSVADGRAIALAAKAARVPVGVGYQLRLHPGASWLKRAADSGRWGRLLFARAEMGQYLPDWRPWQDYRKSYTARRALGGGIVLDSSHELDLIRWLAGEVRRVVCAARRLSRLEVDVEDTAAAIMELRSGALAEVHLDMVSREPRRSLQLTFEHAVAVLELGSGKVRVARGRGKAIQKDFACDLNDCYVEEARLLLKGRPAVTAEDALGSLKLAAAALRSSTTRRWEIP